MSFEAISAARLCVIASPEPDTQLRCYCASNDACPKTQDMQNFAPLRTGCDPDKFSLAHTPNCDKALWKCYAIFSLYVLQLTQRPTPCKRNTMTHERLPKSAAAKSSSNRSFGLVFASIFLLFGLLPLLTHAPIRFWALVLSSVFLLASLAAPWTLGPLNRIWTQFGRMLHIAVSPIALGVLFFGLIAPLGLLMRCFGNDPLRLKFEPRAKTYWIKRESLTPLPGSFRKQF